MNHSGRILYKNKKFNLIECETCNFKHLDPIPSDKELLSYYKKEYFQSAKPEYLSEDRKEIEHRNIFFDQRLDFFTKNAPGRSLLDIGCGDGLFLERAKGRGFKVYGVEPSEQASSIARSNSLNVFNGTLDSFIKQNEKLFDIVHLKNVLEHVNNPNLVLNECIKLLKREGILYLEVPNDFNLFQVFGSWINNESKSWICIPDHINYFNFNSLGKLLLNKKLTILRRDTTFPIYFFLCLKLNFIKNKQLGKKLHLLRVKLELFCLKNSLNGFRHLFYRFLSQIGLGRTVIYYAKKGSS